MIWLFILKNLSDDIAVHLLQDQNEDDEIERLQRVHSLPHEESRYFTFTKKL